MTLPTSRQDRLDFAMDSADEIDPATENGSHGDFVRTTYPHLVPSELRTAAGHRDRRSGRRIVSPRARRLWQLVLHQPTNLRMLTCEVEHLMSSSEAWNDIDAIENALRALVVVGGTPPHAGRPDTANITTSLMLRLYKALGAPETWRKGTVMVAADFLSFVATRAILMTQAMQDLQQKSNRRASILLSDPWAEHALEGFESLRQRAAERLAIEQDQLDRCVEIFSDLQVAPWRCDKLRDLGSFAKAASLRGRYDLLQAIDQYIRRPKLLERFDLQPDAHFYVYAAVCCGVTGEYSLAIANLNQYESSRQASHSRHDPVAQRLAKKKARTAVWCETLRVAYTHAPLADANKLYDQFVALHASHPGAISRANSQSVTGLLKRGDLAALEKWIHDHRFTHEDDVRKLGKAFCQNVSDLLSWNDCMDTARLVLLARHVVVLLTNFLSLCKEHSMQGRTMQAIEECLDLVLAAAISAAPDLLDDSLRLYRSYRKSRQHVSRLEESHHRFFARMPGGLSRRLIGGLALYGRMKDAVILADTWCSEAHRDKDLNQADRRKAIREFVDRSLGGHMIDPQKRGVDVPLSEMLTMYQWLEVYHLKPWRWLQNLVQHRALHRLDEVEKLSKRQQRCLQRCLQTGIVTLNDAKNAKLEADSDETPLLRTRA